MSRENVEVVRAVYAALQKGDLPPALVADDFEYVNPPDAVEPGISRGRDAYARLHEIYPDFHVHPERYVDAGEEVVVIATAHATGASGVEVKRRLGYVWTVEDGRAIRMRWFSDPAEAFAAAGVSG
jgi:ketosteroid isomerase-like protein